MLNCFVVLQFAQIAEGLGKAKVVLAFVSKQYANSENCRMEIQFALKVDTNVWYFISTWFRSITPDNMIFQIIHSWIAAKTQNIGNL